MNISRIALHAGFTTLALAGTASAAPVYSYYFVEPTYTVSPGATANVLVYLEEFTPEGDTPRFAPGNGVTFASLLLSASDSDAAFDSFTNAASWDSSFTTDLGGGLFELSLLSPLATPVTASEDPLDLGTRRLLLGVLAIEAGPVEGSTDFVASYSDLGISTADESIIDAVSSANFTVTIVPEPTSAIWVLLLTAGLTRRRSA